MKNVKKLLLIISAVTVLSAAGIEGVSAETKYKKNSEIQEPVPYSVVNAYKNGNYAVMYNYKNGYIDGQMKGKIDPIYLGQMADSGNLMGGDPTTYQMIESIQNMPLTELGVNSTLSELVSYMTVDKNGKNPQYWTASMDLHDQGYNMPKYRSVSFNSWNKEAGKGLILHFRVYKDDSRIELNDVIFEKANDDFPYLNNGETKKLFKELEEIKLKDTGNAVNTVSNTNKTSADASQWKTYDGKNYYWNGTAYAKGWQEIDGKKYYFDNDGVMKHNAVVDGYYLTKSGASTNTKDLDYNAKAYMSELSPEYRKQVYGKISDDELYQILISNLSNYNTFEAE